MIISDLIYDTTVRNIDDDDDSRVRSSRSFYQSKSVYIYFRRRVMLPFSQKKEQDEEKPFQII